MRSSSRFNAELPQPLAWDPALIVFDALRHAGATATVDAAKPCRP